MLETTGWLEFNNDGEKPFKIVRWFMKFLVTIPKIMKSGIETTEGFAAVGCIDFPHEHKYKEEKPDVTPMLRCTDQEDVEEVCFEGVSWWKTR
jgi:hypothetical protein